MMLKKTKLTALALIMLTSGMFGVSQMYVGGYEVRAEGRVIGYVDNIEDVKRIATEFDEEIFEGYGIEKLISDKLKITKKINLKENITDKKELKRNLGSLSELISEAYVLVINDEKTIAFENLKEMYITLVALKDMYRVDGYSTEFCEELGYITDYINNTEIYDSDTALEYIKENKLINVKCEVESNYKGTVDFETVKENDENMYKGSVSIVKEGEVGEKNITASVVYINGEETLREIINEEIIKKPVNQIEKIGTMEGVKGFIMPVSGRLTSEYGTRWGRFHNGLDIAADVGTKIIASDNGKVIFAKNSGSFGLLVKIDHNNGYVTYYAHCSELMVKEGDRVSRGDVIALVGNTGNSTGPHCHFEIRHNNTPVDPKTLIQ